MQSSSCCDVMRSNPYGYVLKISRKCQNSSFHLFGYFHIKSLIRFKQQLHQFYPFSWWVVLLYNIVVQYYRCLDLAELSPQLIKGRHSLSCMHGAFMEVVTSAKCTRRPNLKAARKEMVLLWHVRNWCRMANTSVFIGVPMNYTHS